MILFCITLLLLHQGYSLTPVTTVQLGESVTFICVLPGYEFARRQLQWFKQSPGDHLKLILTQQKNTQPVYGAGFSESRFSVSDDKNITYLTILRAVQEDEGMYHCAAVEWSKISWSATYLSLKGNTQRTSDFSVVQHPAGSAPVRPGDSMTLQCSVLSEHHNKMCPGHHSVVWFRAGSNKSHPNIIYTDGNRHGECDKRSDSQKSCIYRFSKNVNSSDAGTYYCAVATCGEILFGKGTNLRIEETASSEFIALVITIIFLVISLIGNIVFICYRTQRAACEQCKGTERTSSQARHHNSSGTVQNITEGGGDLNYAALHFTGRTATSGRKKKELKTEESVYSQAKS